MTIGNYSFTFSDLKAMAPGGKSWIIQGVVDNQHILGKYGILENSLRLSIFLANVAHESAGFKTMTEYGSYKRAERMYGPRGKRPKTARANGNTKVGDGWRYRGSGILQNTWKNNFRRLTKQLKTALNKDPDLLGGKGFVDFVKSPDTLRRDPTYAVWAACAYWKERKLNTLCDANKPKAVCKKVNGGYNGWSDRERKRKKILSLIDNHPYQTWTDWIVSWFSSEKTIRVGDKGRHVKILQEQLNKNGFNCGNPDGNAGLKTKKAIEKCQASAGLEVTGIADKDVYEFLKSKHLGEEWNVVKKIDEKFQISVLVNNNVLKIFDDVHGTKSLSYMFGEIGNDFKEESIENISFRVIKKNDEKSS